MLLRYNYMWIYTDARFCCVAYQANQHAHLLQRYWYLLGNLWIWCIDTWCWALLYLWNNSTIQLEIYSHIWMGVKMLRICFWEFWISMQMCTIIEQEILENWKWLVWIYFSLYAHTHTHTQNSTATTKRRKCYWFFSYELLPMLRFASLEIWLPAQLLIMHW